MKQILLFLSVIIVLCHWGCETDKTDKSAVSHKNIEKLSAITDRLTTINDRLASLSGAPNDHPCIKGNYQHLYYYEDECWECCVPVEDILNDNIDCARGVSIEDAINNNNENTEGERLEVPDYSNGVEYYKITSCCIIHPTKKDTAGNPVYIHVCRKCSETNDDLQN